jgi:hypothetical protein
MANNLLEVLFGIRNSVSKKENSARSEEFTTGNNNDFHVNFIKIHFTYSSQEASRNVESRQSDS